MIYIVMRKIFIAFLSIPLIVICLGGFVMSICVFTVLLPFALAVYIIKSSTTRRFLKNLKKYFSYYKEAAGACYSLATTLFDLAKEYEKS